MLVFGKAYQISKSAIVPTTVRGDSELVEANSKLLAPQRPGRGGRARARRPAHVARRPGLGPRLRRRGVRRHGHRRAAAAPHGRGAPSTGRRRGAAELHSPGILLAASAMGLLRGVVGLPRLPAGLRLQERLAAGSWAWSPAAAQIGFLVGSFVSPTVAQVRRSRSTSSSARSVTVGVVGLGAALTAACWPRAMLSLRRRRGVERGQAGLRRHRPARRARRQPGPLLRPVRDPLPDRVGRGRAHPGGHRHAAAVGFLIMAVASLLSATSYLLGIRGLSLDASARVRGRGAVACAGGADDEAAQRYGLDQTVSFEPEPPPPASTEPGVSDARPAPPPPTAEPSAAAQAAERRRAADEAHRGPRRRAGHRGGRCAGRRRRGRRVRPGPARPRLAPPGLSRGRTASERRVRGWGRRGGRCGPARGRGRRPRPGSAGRARRATAGRGRRRRPARATPLDEGLAPVVGGLGELEAEEALDEAVGRVGLDAASAQRLGDLAVGADELVADLVHRRGRRSRRSRRPAPRTAAAGRAARAIWMAPSSTSGSASRFCISARPSGPWISRSASLFSSARGSGWKPAQVLARGSRRAGPHVGDGRARRGGRPRAGRSTAAGRRAGGSTRRRTRRRCRAPPAARRPGRGMGRSYWPNVRWARWPTMLPAVMPSIIGPIIFMSGASMATGSVAETSSRSSVAASVSSVRSESARRSNSGPVLVEAVLRPRDAGDRRDGATDRSGRARWRCATCSSATRASCSRLDALERIDVGLGLAAGGDATGRAGGPASHAIGPWFWSILARSPKNGMSLNGSSPPKGPSGPESLTRAW